MPGSPTFVHPKRSLRSMPDLRPVVPPPELLYLPPLLSLLPSQTPPLENTKPFSFEKPTVGFTTSRLPRVDEASVALHYALHAFQPTTTDYAYAPYDEAFNWGGLELPEEVEREWCVLDAPLRQQEVTANVVSQVHRCVPQHTSGGLALAGSVRSRPSSTRGGSYGRRTFGVLVRGAQRCRVE